jgi:trehalose synthase
MPLSEVQLFAEPLDRFAPLLGPERMALLDRRMTAMRERLAGRTMWHVNSTATGGGVAEMLQVLLAYVRGAGIDTRWTVVSGEPDFFRVTKRLHNVLHGSPGDGGPLGDAEHAVYERVLAPQAQELADLLRPGDLVLLHDPQTAGLVTAVRAAGAVALWRCHIGADRPNDHTRRGVDFLHPYLAEADGFVFTRQAHVHGWIAQEDVTILPPSIDPFAAKNADLDPGEVRAILASIGALADAGPAAGAPTYRRRDGSPGRVDRGIELTRGGPRPGPDVPAVLQVSRWDRLKDMTGVLRGFAEHVPAPAQLFLVGPSVAGVSDDPEGAEVLAECAEAWDGLAPAVRDRISLVCLPMEDVDENAAMVNAFQRHADVVVQKSLAEGFGLTITEAMWKARPVVASAVGGIVDQITSGEHGLLLDDPTDLAALGAALVHLLGDREFAARLGKAARLRVNEQFLGERHLRQYADLAERYG